MQPKTDDERKRDYERAVLERQARHEAQPPRYGNAYCNGCLHWRETKPIWRFYLCDDCRHEIRHALSQLDAAKKITK